MIVGKAIIGYKNQYFIPLVENLIPFFNWKVSINNIKNYFIGGEDCPISDGSFSVMANGGMDVANISMEKMRVPVWYRDKIKIFYKGIQKYSGYIKNIPDPEGGKIEIYPYSNSFEYALYNKDYSSSAVPITQIIQDVLQSKSSQVEVLYNKSLLDISSTNTYSPTYDYENVKVIFEDLISQLDNGELGSGANDYFYVKRYSTTINHYIYNDDNCPYVSLEYKTDIGKIKNTRKQVFQSSTDNTEIRIGEIGYNSTDYPSLAIENICGIKEERIKATDSLGTTEALSFEYNKMVVESQLPENVKIKNFDLNYKDLQTFELIRIQKPESFIWHTVHNCESTNFFNIGDLVSFSKVGNSALSFYKNLIFDPGETLVYKNPERIGFYVRSNTQGTNLNIYLNTTDSEPYSVYIKSLNTWQWNDFKLETNKIRKIYFQPTNEIIVENFISWNEGSWAENSWNNIFTLGDSTSGGSTAYFYLDEIKILSCHREFYQGNIINIDYKIGSDLISFDLGKREETFDDEFQNMKRKIDAMEKTLTA